MITKNFVSDNAKDKRINVLIKFFKGDFGFKKKKPLDKEGLLKALKEEDLMDRFLNSDNVII